MISLVIKLLIKLRKSQKIRHRITQKQLRMSIINKYLKQRYLSPDERQKIIDDLRLIQWYKNEMSKPNKFVRQYTKSTN